MSRRSASTPKIYAWRQATALLLALLFAWMTSLSSFAVTPEGVQCPTAAIQEIRSPVKDCCDHIVGFLTHKPRPGDKGFMQCRCAEKRSSQQQAAVRGSEVKLAMIVDRPESFEIPVLFPYRDTHPGLCPCLTSIPGVPQTPPPIA